MPVRDLSDRTRRTLYHGLSLILDPALKGVEHAIVGLGSAMITVVFVQVVLRYVFNESFYGSEELSRFLFTWFIFMSATLGLERGIHFSVDVFVDLLPRSLQRAIMVVVHLIVLAVLALLVVKGIEFTIRNWGQLSSAMQIQMSYANAAVPAGAFLMFLIVVRRVAGVPDPES